MASMSQLAEAPDLSDAELMEAGIGESGQDGVIFERADTSEPKPGDLLMAHGEGADNRILARLSKTTTDMRRVNIYDIHGNRHVTPVTWAMARLKKRYPANHVNPEYRGQPVWYQKPPTTPLPATVPCRLVASGRCRKMLTSQELADKHFKVKHHDDWLAMEEAEKKSLAERQTEAMERQSALMSQLLGRMAGGDVPQPEVAALVEELRAPEPEPEAAMPDETWKRPDLVKWLKDNGYAVPDDWIGMSQAQLWEYVRALIAPEEVA